ncbi:MAG: SAM-dependent chlorinase/fluorinase [Candidatus Calescibacterium sp.]|nr:SAM-dependent chlorinase/fluorinase [Candidatus Calescibacterium sp.]MCX7972361.1 SAM-dependent chlorinase/fluorinase [bacterium]MDW8195748.1 SAM-dependent chlorinase/fluorinase [Candidatus Calescibacterium sp.]
MIYFITDYGNRDYFVSAVKIVIFNTCKILGISEPTIIDISHEIDSFDIVQAILNIRAILDIIPDKSIILGIVDPEVGSDVSPCISKHVNDSKEIYFVGRNNGILGAFSEYKNSFTYEISIEKIKKDIQKRGIFYKTGIKSISNTFHGRDVFAPITAILYHDIINKSNKVKEYVGSEIKPNYFHLPEPKILDKKIVGQIIYVDKFGNLITNIPTNLITSKVKNIEIAINGHEFRIDNICKNYLEGKDQGLIAIANSFGYIEISRFKSSAKEFLEKFGNIKNIKICINLLS